MAYKITNLGKWETYTPDTKPQGAPEGALFARRVEDGVDWYAFARKANSFPAGALLATAITVDRGNSVSAVTRDPSAIFPAGAYLVQIEGVPADEEKPWKLFEQQNFDPEALTITPFPALPVRVITYKADLWRRMTDAEADTLDADLMEQPAKIRRLFQDAQHIDHSDPLFAMLKAAISMRFGEPRAMEILAPSEE